MTATEEKFFNFAVEKGLAFNSTPRRCEKEIEKHLEKCVTDFFVLYRWVNLATRTIWNSIDWEDQKKIGRSVVWQTKNGHEATKLKKLAAEISDKLKGAK